MNQYCYEVKIYPSKYLEEGRFSSVVSNCREMIISSQPFISFENCEQKLLNLVHTLADDEAETLRVPNFIVSRKNPDWFGEQPASDESWQLDEIEKVYVIHSPRGESGDLTKSSSIAASIRIQH